MTETRSVPVTSSSASRPAPRDAALDTFRRLLTAIFAFLSLFLVVRTIALEPFGVPTGSMAGSFLGNHYEVACPRCGFAVVVGDPGEKDRRNLHEAACPNCGQRSISLAGLTEIPGDRLLVDKNVFELRSPRRWEVCVFRCPVDHTKPYVKRVVGLPGEAMQLKHGDVYANGELQRKTLPQSRECRVLAFDQAFAPPEGWSTRWLYEPLTVPPTASTLAGPEILADGAIVLNAEANPVGLTYRHWNLDSGMEEAFTDWLAYNGASWHRGRETIYDFTASFELEIVSGGGTFACRLFDGLDSAFVEFAIGPQAQASFGRDGDPSFPAELRLQPGRRCRLEVSLTDRRFSVAVDGKVVLPPLDLPAENLESRKGVSRPVQFGVRGAFVKIHNFKLYRDVYLRGDAANGTFTPWPLGPDEYFLLGDNSNNSKDSREWAIPGVPERAFLGKPFLIHQPLKRGTAALGGASRNFQAIDWDRLRWVR